MQEIQIFQSRIFSRLYKRLHTNQKTDVDDAVVEIVRNPTLGEAKAGDLARIYVYKFKCNRQLTLLAYKYDAQSRFLKLLGSHENLSFQSSLLPPLIH